MIRYLIQKWNFLKLLVLVYIHNYRLKRLTIQMKTACKGDSDCALLYLTRMQFYIGQMPNEEPYKDALADYALSLRQMVETKRELERLKSL